MQVNHALMMGCLNFSEKSGKRFPSGELHGSGECLQARFCRELWIYEYKHVDFTWSLPHMSALIEEYIKEGKIKEAGELR